jgi:hypothetical protein
MDPDKWGVSFSIKQCRDLDVDWRDCLRWALEQGWRRFRLMSYWNEIERERGTHDFAALDEQIKLIAEQDGIVTLCLGVKQPRWPEYHWPSWARNLPKAERDKALLSFVRTMVGRYHGNKTIVSWQLENEALLRGFGERIDIDRKRLRQEFLLVKQLDSTRPVIMSTSNSWGLPLRAPIPDIIGFSHYAIIYSHSTYHRTPHLAWLHRLRALLARRPVFVHELQLEPWGPRAIWKMSHEEQDKSMGPAQITHNLHAGRAIQAPPVDLWGLEWWYARHQAGDESTWRAVKAGLAS